MRNVLLPLAALIPLTIASVMSLPPILAVGSENVPQVLPREDVVVETREGPVSFRTEIADDQEEQSKGMMYRTSVGGRDGMLFIFPRPRLITMWMKDTLVPLDMIFIERNGRIIHIEHNAQPGDLASRGTPAFVLAVLEIKGGTAHELGIEPGMFVKHRFFVDSHDHRNN